MKKIIMILIFFLSIGIVHAECIFPYDGMILAEDTEFCQGVYNLPNGIIIGSDNIDLNCNQSQLSGDSINIGISIEEKTGVVISGCILSRYDIAIYLKNSERNTILGNNFSMNNIGIGLYSSPDNELTDNYFSNSIKEDIFSYDLEESETIDESADDFAKEEKKLSPEEMIEQVVRIKNMGISEESMIKEMENIFNKYLETKDNVVIERGFRYDTKNNITEIVLRIKPNKKIKDLKLYDFIPKCVAFYISDIIKKDRDFEIIKEDPLVMWHFIDLESEKSVSYSVNKIIPPECRKLFSEMGIAEIEEEVIMARPEVKKNSRLPLFIGIVMVAGLFVILIITRSKTKI